MEKLSLSLNLVNGINSSLKNTGTLVFGSDNRDTVFEGIIDGDDNRGAGVIGRRPPPTAPSARRRTGDGPT